MILIKLTFPAGRFHATPWGHHVNEGLVEWPPSPWRICRALLAVGFSKLGWQEDTLPDEATELICALAEAPPQFTLPPCVVAHSRHYMPTRDKPTKVLDTFGYVGSAAVFIHWPIELEPGPRRVLGQLLAKLSYLGRAESWATGTLLEPNAEVPLPNAFPCSDENTTRDAANLVLTQQVEVMMPLASLSYSQWRERELPIALQAESFKKKLSAKARTKIEEAYPTTLIECLLTRTSTIRAAGWNQPPGSCKVSYQVPEDALQSARPTSRQRGAAAAPCQCALLALSSDTSRGENLPLLARALPQGEIMHRAAVSRLSKLFGDECQCPELTGKAHGKPVTGHRHVHYLGLGVADPRRIDHVIVYASAGLGARAQKVFESLRETYSKGIRQKIFVTLTGFASCRDLHNALAQAGVSHSPVGLSRRWKSYTPFIAPRFVKRTGKNSIEGQIRTELAQRERFPEPTSIVVDAGSSIADGGFFDFVRSRSAATRRPPTTVPWAISVEFAEPVSGPIAIGYGSHFGLGLLIPD